MLLVAIKCSGDRQTTLMLKHKNSVPGVQLRGYCVHAVGGITGKNLTQNRRNATRKMHNKKSLIGRCCMHVKNWKTKLRCLSPA